MKTFLKYFISLYTLLFTLYGHAQCEWKNALEEDLYNSYELVTHLRTYPQDAYAYKVLYEIKEATKSNIASIQEVSQHLSLVKTADNLIVEIKAVGSYSEWKKLAKVRGEPFKEILIDIPKAISKKLTHITSAEMVTKNGITFRLTGVHSDLAKADIYIVRKQGKTIVSRTKTTDYIVDIQKIDDGLNGVYTGKVIVKDLNGNIIVTKSGNGGVSTFFPNTWSNSKIASEVEFAVKNNKGYIDPTDVNKGYYGFSSDGKIKIGFYYNETLGTINSYFPLIN